MRRKQVEYHASPTCGRFHRSDDFVRGVLGPIGSGKSVACCWEIWRRANEQEPGPDGVRRTRWAIIRNTYRELKDTTLNTWSDWFSPDMIGRWDASDMMHVIDEGDLYIEVLFRALDRPDDVKKLLSLELTGGWINEAREIPRSVLDMLQGRVGRYPKKELSLGFHGATWEGVICDTNPPDTDHWWYRLFEEDRPDGWSMYHQPSGRSPEAENIENLPKDYYQRLMQGHDDAWIAIYVDGQYGFVSDAKPIWPDYSDAIHCAKEDIEPEPGVPLVVGIDFGLTPAATISQDVAGQWRVIDEVVTEDMGALKFGKLLGKHIRQHFQGYEIEFWGDPAGEGRAQTDEKTPFEMLAKSNIEAWPAPTNDFTIRVESVSNRLNRLDSGRPAFILSPRCRVLRKAMMGGYHYKRVQVAGDERYHDKPNKNMYSHVAESLPYGMLGAGEGEALVGGDPRTELDDWSYRINLQRPGRDMRNNRGYSRGR